MSKLEMFVTGTMAYGPVSVGSDIDVVVYRAAAIQIFNFLETKGMDVTELGEYELSSKKFHIGHIPINIIQAENVVDFYRWKYATEHMRAIKPIEDRVERLAQFTSFKDEFNAQISEYTLFNTFNNRKPSPLMYTIIVDFYNKILDLAAEYIATSNIEIKHELDLLIKYVSIALEYVVNKSEYSVVMPQEDLYPVNPNDYDM